LCCAHNEFLSSADDPVTRNPNIEDFWNLETIGIIEPLDITELWNGLTSQFIVRREDITLPGLGSVVILTFQKTLMLL